LIWNDEVISKMRKRLEWLLLHRKWWLLVWAALLVLWAVLWAFVPGWVKDEIQTQAGQKLGRSVKVESVHFQPWSMLLTIKGLDVAAHAGSKDPVSQLKVAEIRANLELSSIWHMAPVLNELSLRQPELRIRHEGKGSYDLDDLIQRFASSEKPASSGPAPFSVYNLGITGGRIDFDDVPAGKKHEVRDLEFALPFISTLRSNRESPVVPHLSFKLNAQSVDLAGEATPFSEHSQAQLRLQIPAMSIREWLPYWPSQLPVQPIEGQLQSDLRLLVVRAHDNQAQKLELHGHVEMKGWQWQFRHGVNKGTVLAVDDVLWRAEHLVWPLSREAGNERAKLTLESSWPRLASASSGKAAAAPTGKLELSVMPLQDKGDIQLKLQDAQLEPLRPWLSAYLTPKLSGSLSATMAGQWQATLGSQTNARQWQGKLQATELVLNDGWLDTAQPRPLASGQTLTASAFASNSLPLAFRRLRLSGVQLDWPLKSIRMDGLELIDPQLELGRDAQGVPSWSRWVASTPSNGSATSSPVARPDFDLDIGKLSVQGGHAVWWDAAAAGPLAAGHEADRSTARLELTQLLAQAKDIQIRQGQPIGKISFELNTQLAQISRQKNLLPGSLQLKGEILAQNLPDKTPAVVVTSQIDAKRIPVHAVEPYLREQLHLALHQAEFSAKAKGFLRHDLTRNEAEEISVKGNASLDNLRASSLNPNEELLSWNSLQWQGLEFQDKRGKAMQIRVGQSTLSDFYARMIVSESGRLNLQDVVGKRPQASDGVKAAAPAPLPAEVYIGPSKLVNGRINFSDHFIKPNYSAALSELNGQLGGFASGTGEGQVQMADLNLTGKAQGSALLTVKGQISPLAKPLALDVQANVRDLELPPLSAYAAKYFGYAIDRGKLHVDVNYKIQPDGKLVANNNFTLHQLTLGERVEGQGSSLPLKLAISLLKDRNGVIDLNLPVSGSVEDPDFQVGPIVWRLVLNLIGRALTSPFSLISSVFSGGSADQAGQVAFDAGSERLTAAGAKQIEQIANAMKERAELKINLAGQSSGVVEKEAYQRDRIQAAVWYEHARLTGVSPSSVAQLSRVDHERALKSVYASSKVKKPRNLIGMAKDIPVAEMEALLMADVPIHEDTWRQLALTRAQQVKDALSKAGLALERMFIVPPQMEGGTGVRITLTAD
jgi:hypothetical protein